MCVNDLPRIGARKRDGRESNVQPADCKSSALTTTPPSRRIQRFSIIMRPYNSSAYVFPRPVWVVCFLSGSSVVVGLETAAALQVPTKMEHIILILAFINKTMLFILSRQTIMNSNRMLTKYNRD